MRRRLFMAGRLTGRNTLFVFISVMRSPIAGPWTVRAVVSTN
ncbi:MAG TPA: hypothetical protein VFZ69_00880 [Longimicrobiales bacterium]